MAGPRVLLVPLVLVLLTLSLPMATSGVTPAAGMEAADRVFPEPRDSSDFITHGPKYAPEQFADGMRELEERHGQYIEFSTIREEMDEPLAVSVGEDGVPAWDPDDTGDGEDFYVVTVTDESVPDADKGYALFTVAHAGEWCGREAIPRFFEDLVTSAATSPDRVLDGGSGLDGTPLEITVGEALERTKLIFVDVSPDGWVAGDKNGDTLGPFAQRGFSQQNGAGINSNRVAYQDGWVFPDDPVIRGNGYSTATQPEGIVTTRYLRGLRDDELGGRPFATSMDFHGPLPIGAQLIHDQGNDPARLDRVHDLAERITQRAYGVLAAYGSEPGASIHQEFAGSAEDLRRAAFRVYNEVFGGVDQKALYVTLHWNEYATAWEHIDYTVSGSFGGWAASEAGLGADGFSHEIPCQVQGSYWEPTQMQLFVDNVRAMSEAMVVHAAFRDQREVIERYDLGGTVGFVDTGQRITDADGNPAPPPPGERTPLTGALEQVPYDVANTDYFRDLRAIATTPIVELAPEDLAEVGAGDVAAAGVAGSGVAGAGVAGAGVAGGSGLSTIVIADHIEADVERLQAFVEAGGNVVLTDAALQLLPGLVGVPQDSVAEHRSYVGYADLDHEHPMTEGLYERARQMFDPVGLGYPLLMERDQYWPCETGSGCEESITANSAPMWTVDRAAWEDVGGETVGTADPAEGPKGEFEGTDTDQTVIGLLEVGDGRVVVYGALLPQPSEEHPHWFGLNPYTISVPGQQLLLRGLTWTLAGEVAPAPDADDASGAGGDDAGGADDASGLPATGGAATIPLAALLLLGLAARARARRP